MKIEISNREYRIIRRKILSMILPITVESILQMTTGIISMAMIGRISPIAVGAIGISTNIFNVIWALFKGISTGVSVFVAQAYGANNCEKLRKISIQTLLFSIILVIILQQVIFWNVVKILEIFNTTEELMENAIIYLKIISWGLPFITIVLIVAGVFQGMGNAKTPMKIALMMNIINIILGYILIFGKLRLSPMGVRGAGYSIVTSQIVAALIGLITLFGKEGLLRTEDGFSWKIEFNQVLSVYRVGLPVSFERIFWQVASIILTRAILTYGEIAYASYQLGLQAESISYMPAAGFSIAATTFIGHAIGSGNVEEGKKYLYQLTKWTAIFTLFTGGLLVFFPEQIMRILTNDIHIIKTGAVYLFVMGIVQMPQNIRGVIEGALRGAGYTKLPTAIAMLGLWGLRLPLSLICAYVLKMPIWSIWIVFGIDLIFRFICNVVVFKRRDILNKGKILIGDE